MVGVVFMDVFDSKVIYNKGECDMAGDMSPQTGCVSYFKISVWLRGIPLGLFFFELAGLW